MVDVVNSCQIVCEACGKKTSYIKKVKNFCKECGREIIIEKQIENLVVALNSLGVVTVSSCAGHRNGFDSNKWSHPCVFLLNDDENRKKAEKLIQRYNRNTSEKDWWVVKRERMTVGVETFIVPVRKERRLEELQREANFLAVLI